MSASSGKEYRNKLSEFLKMYGQKPGGFTAAANFVSNPLQPKVIEIPSYMAAMRSLNLVPINLTAGKK